MRELGLHYMSSSDSSMVRRDSDLEGCRFGADVGGEDDGTDADAVGVDVVDADVVDVVDVAVEANAVLKL